MTFNIFYNQYKSQQEALPLFILKKIHKYCDIVIINN
jgi:hypothetical protein